MADDFYCPECSYVYDKEDMCPFCDVKLVKLDEGLDDFNFSSDGMNDDMDGEEEFGEGLPRTA